MEFPEKNQIKDKKSDEIKNPIEPVPENHTAAADVCAADELREVFEKKHVQSASRTIRGFVISFLKWIAISACTGVVAGLVGTLFHVSVEWANAMRLAHPWLIWLLPFVGLLIAWMYHLSKMNEYTGTDLIITSIRSDTKVPFALAPLIFISTVLTNLAGGSVGREGAALQLGGAIGTKFGRLFHLDKKELSLEILAGMSGVFAALFGTPLTASFFAMEVISVGVYYHSSFIPCIVSSYIAYRISLFFGLKPVAFTLKYVPETDWIPILQVAALAAACALVSILFCQMMHFTRKFLVKYIKNDYARNFLGGVLILGLTFLVGSRDYNGTGMNVIERAINGEAKPEAFLLKILFTAITIGAGFKGGEIVPAFFIGATFGCTAGKWLGMDPGFAAAVGLISVFCGAVNCPIASIFLSYEIFGGESLLLAAIACSISFTLSGYYGLYSSQKIMYSKLKAEYININAK